MKHARELSIAYRDLNTLRPNKRNARTHSRRQVEQIAASIKAFGFTNPILVDENEIVIAGHDRLAAAKVLALKTVPAIQLSGLDESEKRALMLADNKIAMNAGWDTEILRLELESLSELDLTFNLETTGFATGEIDFLLDTHKVDPDDEVIPMGTGSLDVQYGDIWRAGSHSIGCGDSRDLQFLKAVVGVDRKVDAAFLDPPYNVAIQGHANVKRQHAEFAMASGEMTADEFDRFLSQCLSAAASVSRNGAVHFVCMDWRHADALSAVGKRTYDSLLNLCIWNKSNAGMGSLYRSRHEMIFVYRVGEAQHFNAVELGRHGRNRTNVWDYASVNSLRGSRQQDLALHPTVKPVGMVGDAICDVTKRGELVLDTFLGSGTSLIAAERTGRQFAGCDIEPRFVQIALDRWSALTGQRPEKIRCQDISNG